MKIDMANGECSNSVSLTARHGRGTSAELNSAEQLPKSAGGFTEFEGERQMLKEVLLDAIECWQSTSASAAMNEQYFTSRERLYREADLWIFGEYNNPPFFSFTQVCDWLGLNPGFIRRRLLDWRNEQWLMTDSLGNRKEGGDFKIICSESRTS